MIQETSKDNESRGAEVQAHASRLGIHTQISRSVADDGRAARDLQLIDGPCPECGHAIMQALEFPDGRATYCAECGYRGLEQGSAG